MSNIANTLKTFIPLAEKVYDRKTKVDILHNLCVRKGRIYMTDLENYVSMPIDDQRSYCLPLDALKKVMGLKPETMEIELIDERVKIHLNKQTITVPYVDPEEYPVLPDESFKKLGVWHNDVFGKLKKQSPFASTDKLRPALTGIYIKQNRTLSSVATNGQILKWCKNLDTQKTCELLADGEFIMPIKAVNILAQKAQHPATVYLSDKYLKLELPGGETFYVKTINEPYVDYERIIPPELPNSVIFNRKEMLKQIKAAKPFSGISNTLMFSCENGRLNLKTMDIDFGCEFESAVETVDHIGNKLDIYLDMTLLETLLQSIDDDSVVWRYYDDKNKISVFTESDGAINLLMPIRRYDD